MLWSNIVTLAALVVGSPVPIARDLDRSQNTAAFKGPVPRGLLSSLVNVKRNFCHTNSDTCSCDDQGNCFPIVCPEGPNGCGPPTEPFCPDGQTQCGDECCNDGGDNGDALQANSQRLTKRHAVCDPNTQDCSCEEQGTCTSNPPPPVCPDGQSQCRDGTDCCNDGDPPVCPRDTGDCPPDPPCPVGQYQCGEPDICCDDPDTPPCPDDEYQCGDKCCTSPPGEPDSRRRVVKRQDDCEVICDCNSQGICTCNQDPTCTSNCPPGQVGCDTGCCDAGDDAQEQNRRAIKRQDCDGDGDCYCDGEGDCTTNPPGPTCPAGQFQCGDDCCDDGSNGGD